MNTNINININLVIAATIIERVSRMPETLIEGELRKTISYSAWAYPFVEGNNHAKSVYLRIRIGYLKRWWGFYNN